MQSCLAPAVPTMRLDIQLYNQALDYAKEGQWHESERLLVQAIGLNPQEAEYHSLLAVAFLGLGLTSRAIAQLRMAHELNPSDPWYVERVVDRKPPGSLKPSASLGRHTNSKC